MKNLQPSPFAIAMCGVMVCLCAAIWVRIWVRITAGQEVVRFARRRPAPWDFWDLALFFCALAAGSQGMVWLAASVFGVATTDPIAVAAFGVGEILGGIFGLVIVWWRKRFHSRDVGWNLRRLPSDITLGIAGFVAMSVPTYCLQLWLSHVFRPTSHPLVTMLTEETGSFGFLAAAVAAVLAAPVAEELLFRMFLQGWLESLSPIASDGHSAATWATARHLEGTPNGAPTNPLPPESNGYSSKQVRPRPGLWPMTVSASLFALAHWNHGPDPIPLFFLGLALGYLYRQTHRVAPCMVMHACVNGFSLLIMWLDVSGWMTI